MSSFITIIIPTYNAADTLANSISSILKQTFNHFTVLVIDGLSTDDTVYIAESFADSRIKISSEKDSSIYDAMNKGIRLATGEWLYFLGSGDYLHDENVLMDVVTVINSDSVDLIYGDVLLSGRNERYGQEFNVQLLHTFGNLCHQSVFYHNSIFNKVGYYNLDYKINADYDLNIRCFRHPQMKKKYIPRLIAVFNELAGVSGTQRDENFHKQLPLLYIDTVKQRDEKIQSLRSSTEYKIGHYIYSIIKITGIIFILKKIKKFK